VRTHTVSSMRRLFAIGAVTTIALATGAAPASAAVPGYQVAAASSVHSTADFKTVAATCPVNKQLIGTGYSTVTGVGNEIAIDAVIPLASPTVPTGTQVEAAESDATTDSSWSVTARAICAAPLPGLQRVLANSASNSDHVKSATAQCPTGKQLTGTGYSIIGSAGEIVIDRVQPNNLPSGTPTAVTVVAVEADAVAASWSVQAFAVCANPVPGLVQVSAQTSFSSGGDRTVTAACPAGKVLTGAGYLTVATSGVGGELLIDAVRPTSSGGVEVHAVEEDPFAGNWRVDAIAICATA
jgi:hypothetical protein